MSLACSSSVYRLKLTTYGEKCSGGKNSKVRLTGIVNASPTGEKLVSRYRVQKKSWMTGVLLEEWVRKLESSFRAQSRKVFLLIDNCSAYSEMNINLISCLQVQHLFFNQWTRV